MVGLAVVVHDALYRAWSVMDIECRTIHRNALPVRLSRRELVNLECRSLNPGFPPLVHSLATLVIDLFEDRCRSSKLEAPIGLPLTAKAMRRR